MFAKTLTRTSAALAALLAAGPVLAQQDSAQQTTQGQTQQQAASGANQGQAQTQDGQAQPDALIVTVGDARIMTSDVMEAIQALPPQLRNRPPQMLVPSAVDQLVLRELILRQAMAENLAEDPEVVALVEQAGQSAQQEAMVQVWFQRALQEAVTDQAVQQLYGQLQQNAETELPPLEDLRPQIEQQLQRQAVEDIRTGLEDDVRVVFYGPDGQPLAVQPGQANQGGGTQSGQGSSGGSGQSGSGSQGNGGSGQSTGNAGNSGSSGTSGSSGGQSSGSTQSTTGGDASSSQ